MNSTTDLEVKKRYFNSQNLFFFLLILQFVIAPFYYQPNMGGEGLYIPFNSSVWIAAIWIIAAGALLISRYRNLILPRLWLGLACLPLGALLTGFIVETINPTEWLVRICVIVGGYLFFISLFQFRITPKQLDISLYIILAMGMIMAAYGIFQMHMEVKVLPFIPNSHRTSPIGIFQQINVQSSMMATLLVLVYYLVSRPSLSSMSVFIKFTLCITAFAASYNIAGSGSRIGLLGSLVGIAVILLGRWSLYKHHKITFTFLLICTISGFVMQANSLNKTSEKIGGIDTEVRWHIYNISWDLFLESPITGHGLGSFQKVFQDKRREYQLLDSAHLGSEPRFTHPHNELLFWLVEGGIISVMGIIIAAGVTFIQLYKIGWQRGCGYAALLIPISLHTQVELPFYLSSTHWLLILFILFQIYKTDEQKHSTKMMSNAAHKLIVILFIGIAILGSWQMVKIQIANSQLVKYFLGGQRQPELLIDPSNSFYFRDFALFHSYHHKVMREFELKEPSPQPLLDFISYTKHFIVKQPSESNYLALINAYHSLGKFELRDKWLNEAIGTYEKSPRLKLLKEKYDKQR